MEETDNDPENPRGDAPPSTQDGSAQPDVDNETPDSAPAEPSHSTQSGSAQPDVDNDAHVDTNSMDDELQQLKRKRTTALGQATKKRNQLATIIAMDDKEQLGVVKTTYSALFETLRTFQEAHVALMNHDSLVDEDEIQKQQDQFELRTKDFSAFRSCVLQWISRTEDNIADRLESVSSTSKSSSRSSTGSTRSALTRERARIAALLAEQKSQVRIHELQRELADKTLEGEISKAEARCAVYAAEFQTEEVGGTAPAVPTSYVKTGPENVHNAIPPVDSTCPFPRPLNSPDLPVNSSTLNPSARVFSPDCKTHVPDLAPKMNAFTHVACEPFVETNVAPQVFTNSPKSKLNDEGRAIGESCKSSFSNDKKPYVNAFGKSSISSQANPVTSKVEFQTRPSALAPPRDDTQTSRKNVNVQMRYDYASPNANGRTEGMRYDSTQSITNSERMRYDAATSSAPSHEFASMYSTLNDLVKSFSLPNAEVENILWRSYNLSQF